VKSQLTGCQQSPSPSTLTESQLSCYPPPACRAVANGSRVDDTRPVITLSRAVPSRAVQARAWHLCIQKSAPGRRWGVETYGVQFLSEGIDEDPEPVGVLDLVRVFPDDPNERRLGFRIVQLVEACGNDALVRRRILPEYVLPNIRFQSREPTFIEPPPQNSLERIRLSKLSKIATAHQRWELTEGCVCVAVVDHDSARDCGVLAIDQIGENERELTTPWNTAVRAPEARVCRIQVFPSQTS
jgi:hypothetical protein